MKNCTCIKLKTVDQRLTAVQQPVLASGDVGTVRVEYTLDSYWEGYALSGTFYNGKRPEEIYEQQLTEGACVIPWEVLQEDGVLYIGLRGVDDAGLVKTAAPVRYRVEKGSPCGSATAAGPTPDVYQQLLATVNETKDIAQGVRDDAASGAFNGEPGPVGPAGVYVGTEEPTNGETVWIDTDEEPEEPKDETPTAVASPDFAANEGEEGHIKNRTHYVDGNGVVHKLPNKFIDADWMATSEENIDNSVIIPEQNVSSGMWKNRQMDIQPGITYDVHINDVVYPCVAFNEDGICIGNNPSLTRNDLPFCIFWAGGSATAGFFFYNNSDVLSGTIYMKVTGHSWTEYNTLPEEFLPDGVVKSVNGTKPDEKGNVQIEAGGGADIDVTAEVGQTIIVEEVDANGKPTKWKSADYQPRTHGKKIAELLPTTTAAFDGDARTFAVECNFTFVVGNTYTISWNGTDYTVVAVDIDGGAAVGNIDAVSGTGDSGEPFLAMADQGMLVALPLDGSTELVIGVSGEVFKTIDKNYLPSDILYGFAKYTRNPFDIMKWYYQETDTSDLLTPTTDWVDTPITKKQFERLLEVFSTQPIYIRGFDGTGVSVHENGALIEPYEHDGAWRLTYMRFQFSARAQIYLYNLLIRWSDENNCMQRWCELSKELIVSTSVV